MTRIDERPPPLDAHQKPTTATDPSPVDGTVLLVGPSGDPVDRYRRWLEDVCSTVERTSEGQVADRLEDAVSIVVLLAPSPAAVDRTVLRTLRNHPGDRRVLLVAGRPADGRPIPIAIDDVLLRPVSADQLCDRVLAQAARASYQRALHRFYELVTAKTAIEADEDRPDGAAVVDELAAAVETARRDVERAFEALYTLEGYPAVFDGVEPDDLEGTS